MLLQKAGVGSVLFFGVQIIYGWRRPTILSVHSVLLILPKEVYKKAQVVTGNW
jgi:hypothetical protein